MLLTLARRIVFCGVGGKIKVNHCSRKSRTWWFCGSLPIPFILWSWEPQSSVFPIIPVFLICKFMYYLVFFILPGFILRKILLEFNILLSLDLFFFQNKVLLTSRSSWNTQPFCSKGSDQCPWENLLAVHSSIPAWLLAGCLCPCDSVAGGNVSGHQLITLTVWHISMSCHWGLC